MSTDIIVDEQLDDGKFWEDLEEVLEVPMEIEAVFEDLEKLGYAAEANCMCCNTCARAHLEHQEKFVFYHMQDAEVLHETGKCMLGWRGDGHEIVRVLRRHGLKPVWDGTEEQRILIKVPKFGKSPARGGRKPIAETNPEAVALAKSLRRASRKRGKAMSFSKISAKLAEMGHLNEHGKPFAASTVKTMIETRQEPRAQSIEAKLDRFMGMSLLADVISMASRVPNQPAE